LFFGVMRKRAALQSVERALRLSILDGVLAAVMVGVSESYFGACAVALGHTDTALAVLVTAPLLFGALAQACTGPLVLLLGSRKRFVVLGVALQALSHVGLVAVAWTGSHAVWPLLGLISLYFVAGMATQPAWGAWMGALTEQVDRQRYFAIRSAAVSVALLLAFLWGGYQLHGAQLGSNVSHGYAVLFGVGLLARALSTGALALQLDPSTPPRDSLLRVLARTRSALRGERFRLLLGLGLLMFGAQISIPFYAPYMLKTMALGYWGFALMCAVQLAVKSLMFPFAHRIAARFGLDRMLMVSVVLVASVAWGWGAFVSITGLVLVQIVSGVAWAGYEFAAFQLLLRAARPSHRVEFLAVATSLGGLFQLAGALSGSLLLAHAGLTYREVFVVSAVGRSVPLLLLVPMLYDKRLSQAALVTPTPRVSE
jgi:MFS family permease